MADVFDTPPTREELAQVPARPPGESGPDDSLPGGAHLTFSDGAVHSTPSSRSGPAPSMKTEADVVATGLGQRMGQIEGAPPISTHPDETPGEDPWATPPTEDEISKAAKPTVNPEALKFVAQHGDLPEGNRAADIIKYSAASGLPANLVAADFDNVKKRVDAQGVDWKKLAERTPALAQFMAENPHAIPLAQDDTQNLGMIEWALGGHPWEAFKDAWHEQGTIGLQALRAEGVKGLDPDIEQRLADEEKSSSRYGPDYGAHNLLTKGIAASAKFVPYMMLDKASRILGGAVGAIAGAIGGVETGPGAVATTAGGVAMGQFAGSGVFNYLETLGPLSWKLDHMTDAQGNHINPAVANVAAQSASLASGAFMSGSMGLFGNTAAGQKAAGWAQSTVLPGVQKAVQGIAESSVVKWLEDGAVRDAISKALGRWGLHTAIGIGMSAGNTAITAGATEAAKGVSGQDASLANVSNAVVQSGAQAFKDLWLLSAVPSVRGYLADRGLERESAVAAEKLNKSIEFAKKSTMLDKSPEAFEQYVNLAAPNAKVYVPADRWVSYFQDKKLDPAEVASRVGVTPEALTNAVGTGGTLEIPADKFLTHLAKDGHAEGLAMDIKSSPELLTAREFRAKQDSEAKRLVDDAKTRATELDDGKKAIENFVLAQAKASKVKVADVREGAKIMSEAAATQALRLNVSMQESARLMNFGDLSISGKEGPTPAHEAAANAFREWMAPSAAQELAKRQATLSPENKARELYLDKNTGLPNGLHFEDLNQHEAAQSFEPGSDQLFGHAGIEGTKFVNDQRDHGQGNLLYRAAGKALHDADPTASVSKTGGDFELRVRDQAHLDEILKKANENLPPELKGFTITGAVGASREAAEKAHVGLKQTAETAGTRAERGKAPLAFQGDIKTLKLPEAKSSVEVHPELAKQVADMTPEEYFHKAYVEPKTGLLTNLGWQNLARKRYVAAFDLKKLKLANSLLGNAGGDALILQFGKLATHFGGSSFDFARLHGDEYAAQADDPSRLQAFIDRLYDKTKDVGLPLKGGKWLELGFRHGIGRGTYEAADAELNRRKKLESGAEAGAQGLEGGAPKGDAGGVGGQGREGGVGGDLRGEPRGVGAGNVGRGAGPQVYPGSRGVGQEGRSEQVLNQLPLAYIEGRPVTLRASSEADVGGHSVSAEPSVNGPNGRTNLSADSGEAEPHGAQGSGSFGVPGRDVVANGPVRGGKGSAAGGASVDTDVSRQPPVQEPISDDVRRASESLSEAIKSPAFRSKGLGGLDVEGRRQVLLGVIGVIQNRQILDAVVRSVPIDVMHDLGGKKLSPEVLLHDPSVLENLLSPDGDFSVPKRVKAASKLAAAVTRATAILSGGPSDSPRLSEKFLPAGVARDLEQRLGVGHGDQGLSGGPVVLHQEGGDGEGPRGEVRIQLDPNGKPRSFDVRILRGDKSTFIHEISHVLSWSLHDLATSDLATEQIKQDYATLLKFAGYESADARLEGLKAGTNTAQEEKISHGFEQYLQEGKAPSRALARVFSRFKDWLLRIYKGTEGVQAQYEQRYAEKLELSDDVRAVFDRLLAQDEALKRAGQAVGGTGELKEAVAGMTPEQAAEYRKKLEDAKTEADQETAKGGGERQKAMDAQREAFRKQTEAELDQKPIYRAWRYLQHGDLPEGETAPTDNEGKPFKLDRAALEKEYGADTEKLMPPGSVKAKGGVPADVLAPLLGYGSGDDLVNALKAAKPRDGAIDQGTQDKMDAAHGPELERATEAALSGVHNDQDLAAAVMELRALAKQINPAFERQARAVDTDALRKNIDRMTAEKLVGDLDPSHYARTERKLALEAAELWGKGEKEASYDKREQRLVNKLLFMSERDARKELEAARERIRNPSEAIRADLGKADPAYRDVHDGLLAAVGLGKPQPGETKGMDDLLNAAERDGHDLGDWQTTARHLLAQPKSWDKELSVNQARDVADAIKNIRHVADESLSVTLMGKKQALDDLRLAIADRTSKVQPAIPRPAYGGKESSLREKLAMKRRGLSAVFQEIETVADMMDGGPSGPARDLLVNSRRQARDRAVELIQQVLDPIRESFEKIPKEIRKLRDQSVDIAHLLPPIDGRTPGYTRSFLWSLFLNLGNEGNIQRLRDGNKWTLENMNAAVSLLSEPELTFLQTVRDVANSLHPELAKAYERRTGLVLGKVEATPIIVNGKEYAGGYWPIRYDKTAEGNQGNRQEINDIKDLLPTNTSPTVTNSATKARQNTVLAPIDLTWNTAPNHFATVIHDIAYGDWVRQVAKVLIKPRAPNPDVPSFDKTATDYLGPERAKEFLPWLRDVSLSKIDSNAGHVADAIKDTGWMRSRLASAAIMLNMPSSVRHLFDPYTTMADSEAVLPHYIAGAYLKVMNPASWGSIPEFGLSKELAYRQATHDDNLRSELGRMGKVTGLLQRGTEVGFALHKWVDMFTTRVGFKAAFDQAIANGASQEQAVQHADDVVARSFPSGDIAEKPPILRTRQGWAAAVMFYGYASKMHNLRSRAFDAMDRSWNAGEDSGQDGKAKAVATVAAKMIGLGLVSAMGGYFAGRGPTKEDDESKGFAKSRLEWLSTETMLSPMDDVPPIVGPAIKATLLGHKTNIASVPELSLIDGQLQRLGNMIHGKKQEDEDRAWKAAAGLVGMMGPLGQANRTIPYIGNVVTGRERPRGPGDFLSGLAYGTHKDQGANPLKDLQDVVSGR